MNYPPNSFILNVTWIHRSPRKERGTWNDLGCRRGRMTGYIHRDTYRTTAFFPKTLFVSQGRIIVLNYLICLSDWPE